MYDRSNQPSWGDPNSLRHTLHQRGNEPTYHGWHGDAQVDIQTPSTNFHQNSVQTPSTNFHQTPRARPTVHFQDPQAVEPGRRSMNQPHPPQTPHTVRFQDPQVGEHGRRSMNPQMPGTMHYQNPQTPNTLLQPARNSTPHMQPPRISQPIMQTPQDRRSLLQSAPDMRRSVPQMRNWNDFDSFHIVDPVTSGPSRNRLRIILKIGISAAVLVLIFVICLVAFWPKGSASSEATPSGSTQGEDSSGAAGKPANPANPSGNTGGSTPSNPSGNPSGSSTGFTGSKLILITWNQEMFSDTAALSRKLSSESKSAPVAIVCQQEAQARFDGPDGWEQIYKERMWGMTKPEQFQTAHQYMTVYSRSVTGHHRSVKVSKTGFERLSNSGKGGMWAMVEICEHSTCVDVVGACSHMPTSPASRNAGLGALLWDIAKKVGYVHAPCDKSEQYPRKECWGSLHGVFVTGDLNYRLDGALKQPPMTEIEMLNWLRKSITDHSWSEMMELDTLTRDTANTLRSPEAAFTCNMPDSYGPTYKVTKSHTCTSDNVVDCFLPHYTKLPTKGEEKEIGLGWLDRVCWYGQMSLDSEEWMYDLTGKSDHVPMYYALNILPRAT